MMCLAIVAGLVITLKFMEAKLSSSVYSSSIKISPIECQRGGDHEGEIVSSVCLEPSCKFKVCCPVCLMEHHGHKYITKWPRTESIKMRIKNVKESLNGLGGKDTDASMLSDTIQDTKKNMKAVLVSWFSQWKLSGRPWIMHSTR